MKQIIIKTAFAILLTVGIIILIQSFSNKIDGEIQVRENNKTYLVNKSANRTLSFTVRITTVTNDTTFDYKTNQIALAPGDETVLDNNTEDRDTTSVIKPKFDPTKPFEEVVGSVKSDELPAKQTTSIKPTVSYKYEITGQQEVRN